MNEQSVDGDRLQHLLGGEELRDLRQRLRSRYERGSLRDQFTSTKKVTNGSGIASVDFTGLPGCGRRGSRQLHAPAPFRTRRRA